MTREAFHRIADHLRSLLRGAEAFTCHLSGEESDFVRFNRGRIRQAGSVRQAHLTIDLIEGKRHAAVIVTLGGDFAADRELVAEVVEELRRQRAELPEDPYLLFPDDVRSTEHVGRGRLPEPAEAIEAIGAVAAERDLVGLFASGEISTGFADSRGQRNWHSLPSFHFDWSVYVEEDRAVKGSYAGTEWSAAELERKAAVAAAHVEALRRPVVTAPPGRYRVFLAAEALWEVFGVLSWGGFGLRAHRTKTTPLLRMVEEGARLHPSVEVYESAVSGIAPRFQESGFLRPDRVTLVERGEYRDCLVSPRSAAEYGAPCNGASRAEAPQSLEMAPGELPAAEALEHVGDGIYVSYLHYLNYSDRPAGRLTGLTRFATFAIRGGEIAGPLRVMRFDESIYRMLGENLRGLTRERTRLFEPGTYDRRSTDAALLPGALVDDFRLTL
ncbi:MAG: metallopeptidase TldD-related protein [Candidatus Binatia bacterium]